MDLTDPAITAARARAALAYQGIVIKTDGQEKTGIGLATLNRILAKTKPRRASIEEMRAIADACPDVPAWFFEHGFAPPVETGEEDLRDRIAQLETRLSQALPEHFGLESDSARQFVEAAKRAALPPGEQPDLPAADQPGEDARDAGP